MSATCKSFIDGLELCWHGSEARTGCGVTGLMVFRILTDALHATPPCLELLKKLDMGLILAVKPGSHSKLFDGLEKLESTHQVHHFEEEEEIGDQVKKKVIRHWRYRNGVLLNHQSDQHTVNFLEYRASFTTGWNF